MIRREWRFTRLVGVVLVEALDSLDQLRMVVDDRPVNRITHNLSTRDKNNHVRSLSTKGGQTMTRMQEWGRRETDERSDSLAGRPSALRVLLDSAAERADHGCVQRLDKTLVSYVARLRLGEGEGLARRRIRVLRPTGLLRFVLQVGGLTTDGAEREGTYDQFELGNNQSANNCQPQSCEAIMGKWPDLVVVVARSSAARL